MKNIIVVNASPRGGGNSDLVTEHLEEALEDREADVTVFMLRDKRVDYCRACGWCQGKDEPAGCMIDDDFTALLPQLDTCDGIVLVSPVYNGQLAARARTFIERTYPFYRSHAPLKSNSHRHDKSGALVCCYWNSPRQETENYVSWTAQDLAQMGCSRTRGLALGGLHGKGAVLDHPEDFEALDELADWLLQE